MQHKLSITFAFLVIGISCFSQTKQIAHFSHSGRRSHMNYSTQDNFGLGRQCSMDTTNKAVQKPIQSNDSLTKKKPPVKISTDTLLVKPAPKTKVNGPNNGQNKAIVPPSTGQKKKPVLSKK